MNGTIQGNQSFFLYILHVKYKRAHTHTNLRLMDQQVGTLRVEHVKQISSIVVSDAYHWFGPMFCRSKDFLSLIKNIKAIIWELVKTI